MANLKYSRQRESIKNFLADRKDHPTADTVYINIRKQYPNISLGTVYRNLALLEEIGEIIKIPSEYGADRFDADTTPHYHFFCRTCQGVSDLVMENIDHINVIAGQNFNGKIEGHNTLFYGTCGDCSNEL